MVRKRPYLEGQERLLLVRASCIWLDILLTISLCPLLPFSIELDDPSTATRSCFNAFSRVDVRVDVKIPGGVNAYVIDLRGERYVLLFWFPFSTQCTTPADIKLLPTSGKKHTSLLFFAPSCTLMTRPSSSRPIAG